MGNNSTSRRAVGLVVVVFALGIALGVVGTRQWDAHVQASQQHPDFLKQLKSELNPSAEQASKIDAILDEDRSRWHALDIQRHAEWDPKYAPMEKASHSEWDPKYDQVRQQGRDSIRALLTPEQRTKFDAFLERHDQERQKQQQQQQGH